MIIVLCGVTTCDHTDQAPVKQPEERNKYVCVCIFTLCNYLYYVAIVNYNKIYITSSGLFAGYFNSLVFKGLTHIQVISKNKYNNLYNWNSNIKM